MKLWTRDGRRRLGQPSVACVAKRERKREALALDIERTVLGRVRAWQEIENADWYRRQRARRVVGRRIEARP